MKCGGQDYILARNFALPHCYRYQLLLLLRFLLLSFCWMPSVLLPLLFDMSRSSISLFQGEFAVSAQGLDLRLLRGVYEACSMLPYPPLPDRPTCPVYTALPYLILPTHTTIVYISCHTPGLPTGTMLGPPMILVRRSPTPPACQKHSGKSWYRLHGAEALSGRLEKLGRA